MTPKEYKTLSVQEYAHVGLGIVSFTDTYYKYNEFPFIYNLNNVDCLFYKKKLSGFFFGQDKYMHVY